MLRPPFNFKLPFACLSLVFFSSCLPIANKGPIGPHGNGEGIAGRSRTILDYDNARTRCDFTRLKAREYEVTCSAVVKTAQGTELKPTEVLEGVELSWQPPQKLQGPELTLSCQNETLKQNCRVLLESDEETLIEFKLKIEKLSQNISREAKDQVRLPYSVQTFGLVPQTSSYAARSAQTVEPAQRSHSSGSARIRRRIQSKMESDPELLPPIPLGIQVPTIPPELAYLGYPLSSCSVGEKTYFSVGNRVSATFSGGNLIYISDNSGLRLFAGTYSNQPAYPPPAHRVSVYFSKGVHLVCAQNGIYTIERESGRVLFLADSGEVTFIAGKRDESPTSPSNPGPLYCPMSSALKSNGNLVIPSSCNYLIREATPSGQISTLTSVPGASGQRPTAVAIAPDGTIYLALGESNGGSGNPRIDKILPNTSALSPHISASELSSFVRSQENDKTFNDYLMTVDGSGNLLFAGYGGSRIYRKAPLGPIEVWAGALWSPPSSAACQRDFPPSEGATEAQFAFISSLSLRSDGELDIVDRLHCQIRRIKNDRSVFSVVRMKTSFSDEGVFNKPLDKAVFPRIVSMAMTADGSIYFTEPYSFNIHKISADGKTLSHIPIPNATGTLGSQDSWKKHVALAAGASNDLYVLTRTTPHLRKLSARGEWTSVGNLSDALNSDYTDLSIGQDQNPYLTFRLTFGTGSSQSQILKWNFTSNTAESLFEISTNQIDFLPMAATATKEGIVYYSGSAQSAIFTPQSASTAIRVAGQLNTRGFTGDGAEALQAKLSSPLTLTTDRSGNIYFADSENGRIRKLTRQASGTFIISTLIGGDSAIDCSGNIHQESAAENAESNIQQALARLCYYKITDLSIQNSCHEPNGDIKIAFVQRYTDNASIVRVTRPCSTP